MRVQVLCSFLYLHARTVKKTLFIFIAYFKGLFVIFFSNLTILKFYNQNEPISFFGLVFGVHYTFERFANFVGFLFS